MGFYTMLLRFRCWVMCAGILESCRQGEWGVDLVVELANLGSPLQAPPQISNMLCLHHANVLCNHSYWCSQNVRSSLNA